MNKQAKIKRCRFNIALSDRAEFQSSRFINRLWNNPEDMKIVFSVNMMVCDRLN